MGQVCVILFKQKLILLAKRGRMTSSLVWQPDVASQEESTNYRIHGPN